MRRRPGRRYRLAAVLSMTCLLAVSPLIAQTKGPTDDELKALFRDLLASGDANHDGKLTLAECLAISRSNAKVSRDCRSWDLNGDGVIIEAEYVKQSGRDLR